MNSFTRMKMFRPININVYSADKVFIRRNSIYSNHMESYSIRLDVNNRTLKTAIIKPTKNYNRTIHAGDYNSCGQSLVNKSAHYADLILQGYNFMGNTFRNIFFIPKPIPKHLGRWKIEQCAIQLNKKIDLSNEDHCGPCGQYALDKQSEKHNVVKP